MDQNNTAYLFAFLNSLHSKNGTRIKKRSPGRLLKQAIWLSWVEDQPNLSLHEIAEKLFPEEGKENRSFRRWLNLEVTISASAAKRIEQHFPGTTNILLNPLFDLLEPKISPKRFNEIEASFLHIKDDYRVWNLPPSSNLKRQGQLISEFATRQLLARMDDWGFLALLILLRQAEFNNDSDNHFYYMRDIYQAFPVIARNPGYKDHWQELLECLILLSFKLPTTPWLVKPSLKLIGEQIHSDSFTTLGRKKFYIEAKFPENN